MSLYFTSDLHFGDPRLEIFSRDFFFNSLEEMHDTIINNFNQVLKPEDTLVIIGDVCYDSNYIDLIDRIECKDKILIIGNYDTDKLNLLKDKFVVIHDQKYIQLEYKENDYFGILVSHKPVDIVNAKFNSDISETLEFGICGQVHGLWKVQKYPIPIVNVSVECWNFKPVTFSRLLEHYHAIINYYDENVFLCELLNQKEDQND